MGNLYISLGNKAILPGKIFLPYLSSSLPSRVNPLKGLGGLLDEKKLAEIHKMLENFHGLTVFFKLNRSLYKQGCAICNIYALPLKNKICAQIQELDSAVKGETFSRFTKILIDCGRYLPILKIYLLNNPKKFLDLDGFKRTPIHNAVSPNCSDVHSLPFVEFTLWMNRTHHLGLLTMRDCEGLTPYKRISASTPKEIVARLEQEEEVIKEICADALKDIMTKIESPSPAPFNPPLSVKPLLTIVPKNLVTIESRATEVHQPPKPSSQDIKSRGWKLFSRFLLFAILIIACVLILYGIKH